VEPAYNNSHNILYNRDAVSGKVFPLARVQDPDSAYARPQPPYHQHQCYNTNRPCVKAANSG
jgi:hypothetical protein